MANAYAETDLKTLIDADTWTVDPDGVTKNCYIWAEEHTIAKNLDNPGLWNTTTNNVIIVIHPASRSTLGRSTGSDSFSYIGEMKVFANTVANLKSALNLLKTLVDQNSYWQFHIPGVNGDPKNNKYWSNIIYNYFKYLAH